MNLIKLQLVLLVVIWVNLITQGQGVDTIYYDSKWNETTNINYSYYRLTSQGSDGLYHCSDFWNDGKIQMAGTFSSLNPEIREGKFIWYYKNGNIKQVVNHQNNLVIGKIIHFNENGEMDFSYCLYTDSLDNSKDFKTAINKFRKFTEKEIKYPENSLKESIEGQVMTTFYINPEGKLERFNILSGVNSELNTEAERVIKLYDGWPKPIYKKEKTFVAITFPIIFKFK